jgi:hypothetical protein
MAVEFTTKAQLDALNAKIAAKLNTLASRIGSLTSLTTTAKGSLVAAINELQGLLASAALINDAAANTTTAWSGSKVTSALAALKTEILGGAGGAYDTLKELQDLITADASGMTALTTAIGNRLQFDTTQTLTGPQQTQLLANAGITVSVTDLAAALEAATTGI